MKLRTIPQNMLLFISRLVPNFLCMHQTLSLESLLNEDGKNALIDQIQPMSRFELSLCCVMHFTVDMISSEPCEGQMDQAHPGNPLYQVL